MRLKPKTQYRAVLNDNRWHQRRDRIKQRDGYRCQNPYCLSSRNEIVDVHHKFYVWDRKPWLYPDSVLITLCRSCHTALHDKEQMQIFQDDYALIREKYLTKLTNSFIRYMNDSDFMARVDERIKKYKAA